ncbi:hypothetical protein FSP39_017330 [Pinctada imbricata]|uniref:Tryptophan synthase beta chain-like PALP domain-containing protein n=1 Tax=Pinctada imbricata TaxID=66713 RepID=A0AA89BKQ3_PINIB|nr:hypothetical protein FSP39_017330 [Pinctada imbricata]
MASDDSRPTFISILNSLSRIKLFVSYTPVITNDNLNKDIGRNVFFKAENLQKTGSFKVRGALNAVTHSSGNHGLALAWAANILNLRCVVVVPRDVPPVKIQAIMKHGAEVVRCDPTYTARARKCDEFVELDNLSFIPTSDHNDVISGQGTIAIEFLQQVPDLDAILVSTSGGGMISGIAVAAKHIKPDIKVFMVEPEGKHCEKCLRSGLRLWSDPPEVIDTIADGIRSQQLGKLTWPIILDQVEKDVFSMTDDKIIDGMKYSFEHLKLVIEPAAGAAVAAVLSDKMSSLDPHIKNIGVVICGGNVDIENLPWMKKTNISTNGTT